MSKAKAKRSRVQQSAAPASTAQKAPQLTEAEQGSIMVARTGDVREVPFREGITVKQALAAAQFTLDGACEIRVNSRPCTDHGTVLSAGDQVLIIGRIRGA